MARDCGDNLPNTTSDLNRHLDNANRLYIYNKEDGTYKLLGVAETPGLVGSNEDGLVYPELFNTIKKIQGLQQDGVYNSFQLSDTKPYFYYFYNGDKLIKFRYINQTSELWIEVDRAALYKKLFANAICAGSRGDKGDKGFKGRDGLSAPNERFIIPFPDGRFSTSVPTPIDEDISVRVFDKVNEQLFEVFISVDGEIEGDEYKEFFDELKFEDGTLSGKLKDGSNKLKARQRGAKGPDGKDGRNYIEVVEEFDEFVVAKDAIISLRKANIGNNIKFRKLVVTETPNVVRAMFPTLIDLIGVDKWVAAEFSTQPSKLIKMHELQEIELEKPDLDLPVWVPSPGCVSPAATLYDLPSGGNFEIIEDPRVVSNCKEDLWFCENSSGNCTEGIAIRGDPPPPPPSDYPEVDAFPELASETSNTINQAIIFNKGSKVIDDFYNIESVNNALSVENHSNEGDMIFDNIVSSRIEVLENNILPKFNINGKWEVESSTKKSVYGRCSGAGVLEFEFHSNGTDTISVNCSSYNGLDIYINGNKADIVFGNIIMNSGINEIKVTSKDVSNSIVDINII